MKGTKKQARKRHRIASQRNERNRMVRSRVRRQMRKMREAVAADDAAAVSTLLPETMSIIDVGRRKGVLHHNTASRYKARMAAQASRLSTAAEA